MPHFYQHLKDLVDTAQRIASDGPAFSDALKNIDAIDDRLLLLERVLALMSKLGRSESTEKEKIIAAKMQQLTIALLYNDLPHPASSYMRLPPSSTGLPPPNPSLRPGADPVNYAFRSADGSYYNPLFNQMGKAGSPYARSVPGLTAVPASSLPDANLVFDTLLARDEFVEHPGGISSLFFAFADLVIHSIFNTRHSDWSINDTSSYLDLSILYGNNEAQVDSVRRKDGCGRLWEDVFADSRLLLMPPASCALLILMSRNHNYIALKIRNINERKKYTSEFKNDAEMLKQDDEIFNRARLVNCGFFMQIILRDYVGAILGLARDRNDWRLDPLAATRSVTHEVSPRGEGNVVSIEFNLLYRWHATLSRDDTTWTENLFKKLLGPDTDPSSLNPATFAAAAGKLLRPNGDVKTWTFSELKRGPDGRFSDDDLARIIQHASGTRAGSFKARGVPHALKVIEVLSIEQARHWGACTMNEFRKFIGLKPFAKFEDWNSNPDIARSAEKLYKHVDNLELYVGLQAEEAKEPGDGAGLCPGYTVSRAILADAVSLTRGDRFLTVDFTPFNLTSWGYNDCKADLNDGSYGGILTKLLYRTLPHHYSTNSAYAHFPFLDPKFMKDKVPKAMVKEYEWDAPSSPMRVVVVKGEADVNQVLKNSKVFGLDYETRLAGIVSKTALSHVPDVWKLIDSELSKHVEYLEQQTKALLDEKSYAHHGSSKYVVDIVNDVINLLPVRWIAHELAGLQHSDKHEQSEQQWYEKFSDVCQYTFVNIDSSSDWSLRYSSKKTYSEFKDTVVAHIEHRNSSLLNRRESETHSSSHGFLNKLHGSFREPKEVKNVDSESGYEHHEIMASSLFAAVVPTAAYFSKILALAFQHYLVHDEKREEIVHLAQRHTAEDRVKVVHLIRDALDSEPLTRTALQDAVLGESSVSVTTGDRIVVQGPLLGEHAHGLLHSKFFEAAAPRILGTLLSIHDIKPAPINPSTGTFTEFTEETTDGVRQRLYITLSGAVKPWPDSLNIEFAKK
ncbi:heme peroxidase [Mycena floridula]|nr:heme peroxidase [Mycena floridula]